MLTKLVTAAFVLTLAPEAFATTRTTETLIEEIDVTPVNAGINPDAFAYAIGAKVLLGGNPCEAKGVRASLGQRRSGDVLVVTPLKTRPVGPRICPRIWRPVYATVRTTVRGLSSLVSDVVVKNIGELGTETSVSNLLEQGNELTFSGVLGSVMAIGGETTGHALTLPTGETIELDLATNNLDRNLLELDGQNITVQGVYKTVAGIEIATRRVLEVSSLEASN